MPYTTWAKVAAKVGGEDRLINAVLGAGRQDETANDHPFFDSQSPLVDAEIDAALSDGGYVTPLASITDPLLENAAIGLMVGRLSEDNSSREPWMEKMEASARLLLKAIAEGDHIVAGAVLATTDDESSGAVFGENHEVPMWNALDPFSGVNEVFRSIGPSPWDRRWR